MTKLVMAFSFFGLTCGFLASPALAANPGEDTGSVAHALLSGDYVGAEAQIAAMGPEASRDAVMLINLGNAYAGMGRRADAQLAYRAAIQAEPDVELDLADGSVRTVREVATEAINRLGVAYAGR
ncbi:MAG: tetratricopeptide repeat protein [Sphingobium sp.]